MLYPYRPEGLSFSNLKYSSWIDIEWPQQSNDAGFDLHIWNVDLASTSQH